MRALRNGYISSCEGAEPMSKIKKWTSAEHRILMSLIASGVSAREASRQMERSWDSVRQFASRHGISLKHRKGRKTTT